MCMKLSEIVAAISIGGVFADSSLRAAAVTQMRYFELIALLTQAVVDACSASMAANGETTVVDTSFLETGN